jgi:predicted amidohydrolase
MRVRVASLQMEAPTSTDRSDRYVLAEDMLRDVEADLIVLPEIWVTGYFNFERYEAEAEPLDGETSAFVRELATSRGAYVAGGSFVERDSSGRLFNTTFLTDPAGNRLLTYRKIHVFGYRSLESKLLSPGESLEVAATDIGTVGMSTCYDLRFPELYRTLVDRGAEVLIVPAAWPMARRDHWQLFTQARAVENQCIVVACNQAGGEGATQLAGSSRVIEPWGQVLAQGTDRPETLEALFDTDWITEVREEFPVLGDRMLHRTTGGHR